MKSPLLRKAVWDQIRDQFESAEMAQLNAAITGAVICPRGATIDESKLSPALRRKLDAAVQPYERKRK